MEKEVTR